MNTEITESMKNTAAQVLRRFQMYLGEEELTLLCTEIMKAAPSPEQGQAVPAIALLHDLSADLLYIRNNLASKVQDDSWSIWLDKRRAAVEVVLAAAPSPELISPHPIVEETRALAYLKAWLQDVHDIEVKTQFEHALIDDLYDRIQALQATKG
jgi:hypothetical protein